MDKVGLIDNAEAEALLIGYEAEALKNDAVNDEGSSGEEGEVDELLVVRTGEGNIQKEQALDDCSTNQTVAVSVIVTDPRRWAVLATLGATMVYVNLAWVTFSPVADIVACYYGVSLNWINILSWVTMVVYIVGFLPSTWFLNRFGLQMTGNIAGGFVGVAGWLRFAGVGADYYWFLLAGNIAISIQNVLIWNSVSQISGMWFPPNERAFSTAVVGSLGAQVGIFLGAMLSPIVVSSSGFVEVCNVNVSRSSQAFVDWQAHLYPRLLYYLLAQAIFGTIVFLSTFLLPRAPHTPPSISRTFKTSLPPSSFSHTYLKVIQKPYLVFCFMVFGLFIGSGGAFMTVYDQILIHAGYVDDQKYVSYLGMAMQVFAAIAVLLVSRWIDFTKSYYLTTVTITALCTLVVGAFAIFVEFHFPFFLVCIPVVLTRGLVIAFQPVGFEYGAEITFPVSENISNGVINSFNQAWSMLLIIVGGLLVDNDLPLYCILMFAGILLLGSIAMFFIRPELKRLKLDVKDEDIMATCCRINFYRQHRK